MKDLLSNFPEINPNNYGDDEVNALNAWGIAAHTALEQQAAEIERLQREIQNQYRCIESHAEITQRAEAERDALQAKLSAMEKQEPIGCGYVVKWETGDTASTYKSGYAQVLGVDVYAAPKVAQPLSELQINGMCADANISHDIDLIDYTKAVKDAERAHGIGGQQP